MSILQLEQEKDVKIAALKAAILNIEQKYRENVKALIATCNHIDPFGQSAIMPVENYTVCMICGKSDF